MFGDSISLREWLELSQMRFGLVEPFLEPRTPEDTRPSSCGARRLLCSARRRPQGHPADMERFNFWQNTRQVELFGDSISLREWLELSQMRFGLVEPFLEPRTPEDTRPSSCGARRLLCSARRRPQGHPADMERFNFWQNTRQVELFGDSISLREWLELSQMRFGLVEPFLESRTPDDLRPSSCGARRLFLMNTFAKSLSLKRRNGHGSESTHTCGWYRYWWVLRGPP